MKAHPWFKFYAKEWSGDVELRLCSPGARGLLCDIMSLCHHGTPYGYLNRRDGTPYTEDELCLTLVYKPREFREFREELVGRKRILQDSEGTFVPRLVKDRAKLDQASACGARGGSPALGRKPQKPPAPGRVASGSHDFVAFWAVYPKLSGPKTAAAAFAKAIREGATPAEIIAGAKKYAKATAKTDVEYIKAPTKWLDAGCWADVTDAEMTAERSKQKRADAATERYEGVMKECIGYVRDSIGSGVRGAALEGLVGRIATDVQGQLGAGGRDDFKNRAKKLVKEAA